MIGNVTRISLSADPVGDVFFLCMVGVAAIFFIIVLCFLIYISWQLIQGVEFVRKLHQRNNSAWTEIHFLLARPPKSSKVPDSLNDWNIFEHHSGRHCRHSTFAKQLQWTNFDGLPHHNSHPLLDRVVLGTSLHRHRYRLSLQTFP